MKNLKLQVHNTRKIDFLLSTLFLLFAISFMAIHIVFYNYDVSYDMRLTLYIHLFPGLPILGAIIRTKIGPEYHFSGLPTYLKALIFCSLGYCVFMFFYIHGYSVGGIPDYVNGKYFLNKIGGEHIKISKELYSRYSCLLISETSLFGYITSLFVSCMFFHYSRKQKM